MRTVTLELLRHGPPHNQLLSPLTRYLGLCGNHPAVTVEVPFKHSQFLTKLNALQYKESEKTRELQLEDTAEQMTSILASVPGLIAELAECCDGVDEKMTHLRLVLSANELALLPFELANAPNGFPGAGQSLALQSQMPLCITREGRRVSSKYAGWSEKPKILFASASPAGAGPVPRDAHAYVLRQVIEPWVQYHADEKQRREKVGEHLMVLAGASVDAIQQACASGEFTHVHILAHGIAHEKGEDQRFGLALHNARNPSDMDVVEGTRLAAALRTNVAGEESGLSCPAVVTIASCESGQGGSVIGAGASIAHALHEAGIPLVVASQFPLTFAGSVLMAQVLYEGLLWGADPRRLLSGLRRHLKSRVPKAHDWASIVAYASFPADLERELGKAKFEQAKRSIEAALNHADALSGRLSQRYQSGTGGLRGQRTEGVLRPEAVLQALAEPRRKLNEAQKRLEEILDSPGADKSKIAGLLASTQKRLSEILWRAANTSTDIKPEDKTASENDAREALANSRDFYRRAFEADRTQSWGLVQSLALTAALQGSNEIKPDEWRLAKLLSEQDLHLDSRERRAWAHGNLIELYVLALLMPTLPDGLSHHEADQKARAHVELLRKEADPRAWEIHSTKRQILRYLEFFNGLSRFAFGPWPEELLDYLLDQLEAK